MLPAQGCMEETLGVLGVYRFKMVSPCHLIVTLNLGEIILGVQDFQWYSLELQLSYEERLGVYPASNGNKADNVKLFWNIGMEIWSIARVIAVLFQTLSFLSSERGISWQIKQLEVHSAWLNEVYGLGDINLCSKSITTSRWSRPVISRIFPDWTQIQGICQWSNHKWSERMTKVECCIQLLIFTCSQRYFLHKQKCQGPRHFVARNDDDAV